MDNNIVLIGFMGSGKTSVGRELAKIKHIPLLDTDECIVRRQGRTINDIFASDGEAYFRDLETQELRRLLARDEGFVLSVGGGAVLREENRALLRQIGTVVFLRAKTDTLVRRLQGDTTRPLLQGGDLETRINTLMDQRLDIYLDAADVVIDTDDMTVTEAAGKVAEL